MVHNKRKTAIFSGKQHLLSLSKNPPLNPGTTSPPRTDKFPAQARTGADLRKKESAPPPLARIRTPHTHTYAKKVARARLIYTGGVASYSFANSPGVRSSRKRKEARCLRIDIKDARSCVFVMSSVGVARATVSISRGARVVCGGLTVV